MTTTPLAEAYPRDKQARLNQLRDNEDWLRKRLVALEDDQAQAIRGMLEYARRNMDLTLLDVWTRYTDGGKWSTSDPNFRIRMDTLMNDLAAILNETLRMMQHSTLDRMLRAYRMGYLGRAWLIDQALRGAARLRMAGGVSSGTNININPIPLDAIRAWLAHEYKGSTLPDRLADARDEFLRLLRRSLLESQIHGDSIDQAMKRLAALLGMDITRGGADYGLRYKLERIVRTEILRASNQGAHDIYNDNRDIIQGWEFSATLDERTCDECGPLDGKRYDLNEEADQPPLHPNCRCTILPILFAEDLEQRIVGPRQTWSEWANRNGFDTGLM